MPLRRRLGHRRQKTGSVLPLVTDTLRSIVFDISRRNVWPAPFTGRCLRNVHLHRWFGREVELLRHQEEAAATRFAAARRDNDFDIAAVIAGESSGLVRDNCSAREVVERGCARGIGTSCTVVASDSFRIGTRTISARRMVSANAFSVPA
jgi:hypothetical protein